MTRDPLDDWIDAEKYPAATQRCQIHGTYVEPECPRCPKVLIERSEDDDRRRDS